MIPLKLFLAAPLLLPVADGKAGCKHYKPFNTETIIKVHILDSMYEYEVPRKLLTQSREKATKKWQEKQSDIQWATGDLTVEGLAGGMTWRAYESHFVGKPYDRYGQYYCPYVQSVKIDIYYNTMIFVAKEHKQGNCRFNAILEHEHLHHDANVIALQESVEKLEADLPEIIAYLESQPVRRDEMETGFDGLKQGLREAVDVYGKYATQRMRYHNEKIDVPEEYNRVKDQCPR